MAIDDLSDSRHNPDFLSRTLRTRFEIEAILSSFRTQLSIIARTGDQEALDDLYTRVKKASVGFKGKAMMTEPPDSPGALWYREDEKMEMMAQAQVQTHEVEGTDDEDEWQVK